VKLRAHLFKNSILTSTLLRYFRPYAIMFIWLNACVKVKLSLVLTTHYTMTYGDVEQSHSQESLLLKAGLLWNPKIHYRVHKNQQPALSWTTRIQSIRLNTLPNIHFNIIIPPKPVFWVVSSLQTFKRKIFYAFLTLSMRVTCPAHFILLDFMTLIIFG
jgi:hypothetical protein